MKRKDFFKHVGTLGIGSVIAPGTLMATLTKLGGENTAMATKHIELGYKIEPVGIRNVRLKSGFWLDIVKRVQDTTIGYGIQKIKEEGRLDNFLIAGGKMSGKVKGKTPFDDSDVYKIIEGASNSLINAPDPGLDKELDEMISTIRVGQEADGYLTTWRTISPANPPASWVPVTTGKRWDGLRLSHELYNVGHLYHAAAAHFRATEKRNLLDIALKNADLVSDTFGNEPGQNHGVPGHQVIETGLIKLYQVTGNNKYLKTARTFLDNRGNPRTHELYGEYSQDHKPVVEQEEVVGHAVRAVYMYAGMTDIAAIQKDRGYYDAVNKLWENMVSRKMYITGGIGSRHRNEGFGSGYELPNLTAYNETCAAVGDIYWCENMFKISGEAKYYDVIERTLYNGLLSGLSLDGTHFFYPNPLESDGKYQFNHGAATRQEWFDVSCCPTNLMRMLPSVSRFIYATEGDHQVFVNLFASSEAQFKLGKSDIKIIQKTNYPKDGKIEIMVLPDVATNFKLKIRIPGWLRNEPLPGDLYHYEERSSEDFEVSLNGSHIRNNVEEGYLTIDKEWKSGDCIVLDLPFKINKVRANPNVEGIQQKVALEYGPFVYAVEGIDNKDNFNKISVHPDTKFEIKMEENLLKGVQTLNFDGIKAVPYYAWSNRGEGMMKVWLDYEE